MTRILLKIRITFKENQKRLDVSQTTQTHDQIHEKFLRQCTTELKTLKFKYYGIRLVLFHKIWLDILKAP